MPQERRSSYGTAMIRIFDIASHDRQQLLVPAVFALGAAGAAGILSRYHDVIFRPYFGQVHPLPAVLVIGLLGLVALRVLSLHWKFRMYAGRDSEKGAIHASRLASLFALVMILVDWRVQLPYSHVPPPQSLLFYPVMAFVAEVMFHALPLSILLALLGPLFKDRSPTGLVWLCIILASCPEPIFQVSWRSSESSLSWTDVYVGLHVFAFNVLQLALFRRYDFVSMYACRLVYYAEWHMAWGYARQYVLPVS